MEGDILVVEDLNHKFADISQSLQNCGISTERIDRASTVVDAENKFLTLNYALMILDISMDIVSTSPGTNRSGHAALGGLEIAHKMFLLEKEIPTIIVTGFDVFPSENEQPGNIEILGLDEVKKRVKIFLKHNFLGCIHYTSPEWNDEFEKIIREII